jgi:hypothetical protein
MTPSSLARFVLSILSFISATSALWGAMASPDEGIL